MSTPFDPSHAFGHTSRWDQRARRQLTADGALLAAAAPTTPVPADLVTEEDLAPLPAPAQRYLRFMGVVGRPRVRSFSARFVGQIRMKPTQVWMPFRMHQRNCADPVTRLARMRIAVGGWMPMYGTDTYVGGAGRMHGKLLGLVTVADGTGVEFDLGELVTYVNDAALLAPSMLLTPQCEWSAVDDDSFDLTFTDGENVVRASVWVDGAGRLTDFRTKDRWYAGTNPPIRTMWSTPVPGWTTLPDGRPIPTTGSAVWFLPTRDFTYVRGAFDPTSIEFDTGAAAIPLDIDLDLTADVHGQALVDR